jgi:site-specific DNA recombinase
MQKMRESKQRITHQLEGTVDDLEPGRAVLLAALELLDRPRDLYHAAPDDARKILNKAIFTRLYLDSADRLPSATAARLSEPFASLVHATRTTNGTRTPPTPTDADAPEEATTKHLGDLIACALAGQSASKAAMVELTGLEPVTPALPVRCATSCATAPKRSPRTCRGA